MNVTIFGGDNIERINCSLCERGYCVIKHVSGRKNNHKGMEIPKNSDVVIVFTDYINHCLCSKIKKEAQKLGVRTIFSKRSWGDCEKNSVK
ncbi:MAG TPA: DUF2325 domain-containing protein [Acetivibrio sp.]|nr:DUF2325 domain-containing protein [Acetivibrio sp.]